MSAQEIETLTASGAKSLAREAYIFGLPLLITSTTIDLASNVPKATGKQSPVNQFNHHRDFPAADNRRVVLFNLDTLYTIANLDLEKEPMVLSVPDMGGRFWLMQVVNAWNDVPQAPGSRTMGGKGGDFALIGPSWNGKLPPGVREIRVGTSLAFLAGRIYTAGREDFDAVHKLQDRCKLVPLSKWGKAYAPPDDVPVKPGVDTKTPANRQIAAMTPETYFRTLNALLKGNPPYPADAPLMERIGRIGIEPGAEFRMDGFPGEVRKAVEEGLAAGRKAVDEEQSRLGEMANGWQISLDTGRYGTRYAYRAAWAYNALGANLPEDALYPIAMTDGEGRRLNGSNKYELRFPKGGRPPVDAFWSVTMYDVDGYFIPNPIDRRTLGDRSNLKPGEDGSLTLYIQSDSPGRERESNWLPAPANQEFKIAMRLYLPKKEVLDGSWKPPAIKRI